MTLGLPTSEQYARPAYRYVPYHPDLVCEWVWGYSFGQQRALLVPRSYTYYGSVDQQSFAYEISNECALGSCLEEAILYGSLEVLERDAFLLTWYAQLGVPRLDIASIPDQRVRWLLEHLEYSSGYTLSIFNTTLLHGAPYCWVMGIDTKQRTDFPRMVCTAGSHMLPEGAIMGGLLELSAMLAPDNLQGRFQREQQHALEMLHDPWQVKSMDDHSTLYMLPEAFARLDFLVHTPRQQTFQQAFGSFTSPAPSGDLTEDLTSFPNEKEGIAKLTIPFGQMYANELRRRRPRCGDKWHLDEVYLKINGKTHYLWRAVDQDGNVLDILVQSCRNKQAAKRFFRKLLKELHYVPRVIITDKLKSYGAAKREILPGVAHRQHKGLNNRAENSHQPTRLREKKMAEQSCRKFAPTNALA